MKGLTALHSTKYGILFINISYNLEIIIFISTSLVHVVKTVTGKHNYKTQNKLIKNSFILDTC